MTGAEHMIIHRLMAAQVEKLADLVEDTVAYAATLKTQLAKRQTSALSRADVLELIRPSRNGHL